MKKLCEKVVCFAAICAIGLSLSSCGPKLSATNLAKIDPGMSAQQVQDILGKPDDTHDEHALGFVGTRLTYHAKASDVIIVLVNNKVISVRGKIDPN